MQGKDDQYCFSCCAAEHLGKRCFLFGIKVDDDGKRWALVSPWVKEVPIDEVVTYSRKNSLSEIPESGLIPIPYNAEPNT